MSLFSLMFLAGFPDTYRQGSLAYTKKGGGGDEVQKVVVTNYSPEQTSVNAVNFKVRFVCICCSIYPKIYWNVMMEKTMVALVVIFYLHQLFYN